MALMQVVLKASKLCNLRCRYCYEFDQLGNRERIVEASLELIFSNLRVAAEGITSVDRMEIIWHGGEPTLLGEQYFESAISIQRNHFAGSRVQVTHSIQTNLYVLSGDLLRFLSGPVFSKVGVSIDVAGGLRVNKSGQDSVHRVTANLDKLIASRKDVGAIIVLSRDNMNSLPDIINFLEVRSMSFRISPIYRSSFEDQNAARSLSASEMIKIYCWLIRRWLYSNTNRRCEPVTNYIRIALKVLAHKRGKSNALDSRDQLQIIDTDGSIYYQADAYNPIYVHGNYISDPLGNSEGKRASNTEANARMQRHCFGCEFFGPCTGFPVVEATDEERLMFDPKTGSRCPVVFPVLVYTVGLLRKELRENMVTI